MRASKQSNQFARQLFRLSLEEGQVSAERVAAVLAHLAQHPPRQPLAVLRRYHRLVARQLARNRALVEHGGPVDDGLLRAIEAASPGNTSGRSPPLRAPIRILLPACASALATTFMKLPWPASSPPCPPMPDPSLIFAFSTINCVSRS